MALYDGYNDDGFYDEEDWVSTSRYRRPVRVRTQRQRGWTTADFKTLAIILAVLILAPLLFALHVAHVEGQLQDRVQFFKYQSEQQSVLHIEQP